MDSLLELFVHVDDFCQEFLPKLEQLLLNTGVIKRRRERSLSMSEVMTILIHFHQLRYRNFKAYYSEYVVPHLRPSTSSPKMIRLIMLPGILICLPASGMPRSLSYACPGHPVANHAIRIRL